MLSRPVLPRRFEVFGKTWRDCSGSKLSRSWCNALAKQLSVTWCSLIWSQKCVRPKWGSAGTGFQTWEGLTSPAFPGSGAKQRLLSIILSIGCESMHSLLLSCLSFALTLHCRLVGNIMCDPQRGWCCGL